MQKGTKSELQQLREFGLFYMAIVKCHFCFKPLLPLPATATWGHRRHGPVEVKITAHHIDFDRNHNAQANIGWAHSACHKKFHAEERRVSNARPLSPDL